jgi:beta-lactamase class A
VWLGLGSLGQDDGRVALYRPDRLPLLLPAGTPIGHKTGDVDDFTHDGGLVLLPSRPYAIVVLAQGESLADGKGVVAELSRLAYAYFSGGA